MCLYIGKNNKKKQTISLNQTNIDFLLGTRTIVMSIEYECAQRASEATSCTCSADQQEANSPHSCAVMLLCGSFSLCCMHRSCSHLLHQDTHFAQFSSGRSVLLYNRGEGKFLDFDFADSRVSLLNSECFDVQGHSRRWVQTVASAL